MKSEAFFGFTVSEVMIAMTIIGVIAAMTVPIVVSRYQQQSMLALLKKNYVELQENLLLFYADNFNKNFYQTKLAGSTDDVGDFFKEYYSITTDCGKNQTPSECFNFTYRSIDKSQNGVVITCRGGYSAVVKGGASICIVPGKAKIEEDEEAGTEAVDATPVHVIIDVNGKDKPNLACRDKFSFYIYDYYTIDDGTSGNFIGPEKIKDGTAVEAREDLFKKYGVSSASGVGCFGKILNDNWEMKY